MGNVATSPLIYNGKDQAPTPIVKTGDIDLENKKYEVNVYKNLNEQKLIAGEYTKVGDYFAKVELKTDYKNNYVMKDGTKEYTAYTITEYEIPVAWSKDPLIYNKNAQAPTAKVTINDTEYACDVTVDAKQHINAGEYTATAALGTAALAALGENASNYKLADKTSTFSIKMSGYCENRE